jgi:hypothetical protein
MIPFPSHSAVIITVNTFPGRQTDYDVTFVSFGRAILMSLQYERMRQNTNSNNKYEVVIKMMMLLL